MITFNCFVGTARQSGDALGVLGVLGVLDAAHDAPERQLPQNLRREGVWGRR